MGIGHLKYLDRGNARPVQAAIGPSCLLVVNRSEDEPSRVIEVHRELPYTIRPQWMATSLRQVPHVFKSRRRIKLVEPAPQARRAVRAHPASCLLLAIAELPDPAVPEYYIHSICSGKFC